MPEQVIWYGNCDDVPFFKEPCQVILSVEGENEEMVAELVVQGVKVYEGIEVANFEDDIPNCIGMVPRWWQHDF